MSVEDDRTLELVSVAPAMGLLQPLIDEAVEQTLHRTIEAIALMASNEATKHSDSYRELHEGMRFTEANAHFAKSEALRDFAALLLGKLDK